MYPKDNAINDVNDNPLEKGRDLFDLFRPCYIRAFADAKDYKADSGKVLEGTCFYNQYASEIREANGWNRLLSNSAKIVNILGGYGYQPALAAMDDCIESACRGEIVR